MITCDLKIVLLWKVLCMLLSNIQYYFVIQASNAMSYKMYRLSPDVYKILVNSKVIENSKFNIK